MLLDAAPTEEYEHRMDHTFDHDYWDQVWSGERATAMGSSPPNPHLQAQAGGLTPGSVLDAGCGGGAEAVWLAERGWTVTAADIARAALDVGRGRAAAAGVAERIEWIEADLATWRPDTTYDLVTTHYAHPDIPQLAFYERLATWVAPNGTLLIVGHLHPDQHRPDQHRPSTPGHGHGQGNGREEGHPPAEASATAAAITALLDPARWDVVTAEESTRTVTGPGGRERTLHDVVVRATHRP